MRTTFFTTLVIACFNLIAQSPRLSLFEEFTGENCLPCASYNPALNELLLSPLNAPKIISIKWQVPIPTAPSAAWSLYQTNQTEIDWRYQAWGYGYESQNMPTSPITIGINSAPTARIDGQHLWTFGATSDHPYYMSDAVIASAQSVISPFSISMNRTWDPTFTSVAVAVTVQATANYIATGSLIYRLVMTERTIDFATPPGTNGEKKFEDAARASFPSLQAGTPLPANWSIGQTQTFTINCVLPPHIQNKAEVAFVGFIQDDGNKKVEQAGLADAIGTINDAKAVSLGLGDIVCTPLAYPQIAVKNFGNNAITTLTIAPFVDGVPGTTLQWAGNLAVGTTTTLTMSAFLASAGVHTYSCNITAVNGGVDTYTGNNSLQKKFLMAPNFFAAPMTESFTPSTFPPVNWSLINKDNGVSTWHHISNVGAYGSNSGAIKYNFNSNDISSDVDELYLPPMSFTNLSAPVLSFDLAYAQFGPSYDDGLEIKVSDNCGSSWTTVYSKFGAQLATTGSIAGPFAPGASEWITETVLLPTCANDPKVLIKFCSINDKGNNLYLDNVNISQVSTANISRTQTSKIGLRIFPNPTNGITNLEMNYGKFGTARLTVINVLGQIVCERELNLNSGTNTFQLNTTEFTKGVYQIMISGEEGLVVKKLSVN